MQRSTRSTTRHGSSSRLPCILNRKRKRSTEDMEWSLESNVECNETTTAMSSPSTQSHSSPNKITTIGKQSFINANGKASFMSPDTRGSDGYSLLQQEDTGTPRSLCSTTSCSVEDWGIREALPRLYFADSRFVWEYMCQRDIEYARDPDMLSKHPELQARMRSILLDWLTEVCEVYRIHRKTYQRAVDYIDRFLSIEHSTRKQCLQLLGITCLFLAAKIEEIYPPKISDFAFVTDGACTEAEIQLQELVLLQVLEWHLEPVSVIEWLSLLLQVDHMGRKIVDESYLRGNSFVFARQDSIVYVRGAQVLDLCMMDLGSLKFSYGVLAVSAMYFVCSEDIALRASGCKWDEISECVMWMSPFAAILKEQGAPQLKEYSNMPPDEWPLIQTHAFDMDMLTTAQDRLSTLYYDRSPVIVAPGLLSPPSSCRKSDLASSADQRTPKRSNTEMARKRSFLAPRKV